MYPVYIAAEHGHVDCLRYLIDAGARLDRPAAFSLVNADVNVRTPAEAARLNEHDACAALLESDTL